MINLSQTTRCMSYNLTLRSACLHHLWHRTLQFCRQYSTNLTHYEVLGINRNATVEDIRAAFIKKSKECHPDTNSRDPNNHKRFILVNEAYTVLSKPLSRRSYDASLMHNMHHGQSSSNPRPNHHRPEFYYQQMYKERDPKYEDYRSHYSYGTSRHSRISNSRMVAACLVLMWIGMIAHYYTWRRSTALHLRTLDERDAKVHALWMRAKNDAQMYTKEEKLEMLLKNRADSSKASMLNNVNK